MQTTPKPKTIQAVCHCCRRPATNRNGDPKTQAVCSTQAICWQCIVEGGSTTRVCALHPHVAAERLQAIDALIAEATLLSCSRVPHDDCVSNTEDAGILSIHLGTYAEVERLHDLLIDKEA